MFAIGEAERPLLFAQTKLDTELRSPLRRPTEHTSANPELSSSDKRCWVHRWMYPTSRFALSSFQSELGTVPRSVSERSQQMPNEFTTSLSWALPGAGVSPGLAHVPFDTIRWRFRRRRGFADRVYRAGLSRSLETQKRKPTRVLPLRQLRPALHSTQHQRHHGHPRALMIRTPCT